MSISALIYKVAKSCETHWIISCWTHCGSGLLLALALAVSYYSYNNIVLWQLYADIAQVASPAQSIVVALLGLCLFPKARACFAWQLSSSAGGCSKKQSCSWSSEPDRQTAQASSSDSADQAEATDSAATAAFRLGRPFADLSCGISRSYSFTSSRARRRRLPRISIELTPLPRLSLDFQQKKTTHGSFGSCSSSRRLSIDSSCSLEPCPGFGVAGSIGSCAWAPGMIRIQSGQDLQALDVVGCAPQDGVWPASAGNPAEEATGSLGLSSLLDGREHVDEVVNETHLLQVGSMLGEASSRAALLTGEAGGPVNHPTSFYGSADTDAFLSPWEPLITEGSSSVLYWAWRRPLRKGLFMYMTRSVFLEASPAELRAFMNDDAYRVVWDKAMAVLQPLAVVQQGSGNQPGIRNASVEAMAAAVAHRANAAAGRARPAVSNEVLPHETAVMQAQVQFPKPMASRSYIYARRVWPRPSDGGCYCLSKSCTFPNLPPVAGRSVGVEDYCSGCVIKTPSMDLLPAGFAGSAAEVLLVYFEDSHVRPGLANMGIRKGLWPLVQRTDKALRVYQAGAAANMHLESVSQQQEQQQDAQQQDAQQQDAQQQGTRQQQQHSQQENSMLQCQPEKQQPDVCIAPDAGLSRHMSLQLPVKPQGAALPFGQAVSVPCTPLADLQADDDLDDDEGAGAVGEMAEPLQAMATASPTPAGTAAFQVMGKEPIATGHAAQQPAEVTGGVAGPALPQQMNSTGSWERQSANTDVPVSAAGTGDSCCRPTAKQTLGTSHRLAVTGQQQQQQQQQKVLSKQPSAQQAAEAGGKAGKGDGSSGSWWSGCANAVAGVLRGSGQLLATVSVAIWQTHKHLAMLLPALEWRLLHWLLQRLGCSCQLLLGSAASPAAVNGGHGSFASSSKLAKVRSHPIGDWAHPGVVSKLKQLAGGPSVIRLPSHPLSGEDLLQRVASSAAPASTCGCCIRCAAAAECGRAGQLPQAELSGVADPLSADWLAKPACRSRGSSRSGVSCAGACMSLDEAWNRCCRDGCSCSSSFGVDAPAESSGYSDLITPTASCRSCCCCRCSGRASGAGSASSSVCRGSSGQGSCCTGGSHGRVREGGRRHRKLVVKLMQAAGARLAHKLLSVLEHPGGGSVVDDACDGNGGDA